MEKPPIDAWSVDPKNVFVARHDLPRALERSKAFLESIDVATFQSLSNNRKRYLEDNLMVAFDCALADCEFAILEARADLSVRRAHLFHVANLLATLRGNSKAFGLEQKVWAASKKIDEALEQTTVDNWVSWVDYPASLNDGRLYLVWAAEMLADICAFWAALRPEQSFSRAEFLLNYINLGTGFMGWSLYFLRGGVNLAFLFSVSAKIKNLYAYASSDAEKKAYFTDKWDEKKIILLNDAVWGIVNFLCFYFLFGGGMFGYYGDVLNGVLYVFDFALSYWSVLETNDAFEALKLAYQTEEDALLAKIRVFTGDAAAYERLIWTLNDLRRDRKKVERAWRCEIRQLQLDALYSLGTLFAVTILCCFFVPPEILMASTALNLMLVGSLMCFGLGVVHATLSTLSQSQKIAEAIADIEQDSHLSVVEKQKALHEQAVYERYYRAELWCNLLTDLSFPALFLVAFVVMPELTGGLMFLSGLACMFAAKVYVASLAPEAVLEESLPLQLLSKVGGFFKAAGREAEETTAEFFPVPA